MISQNRFSRLWHRVEDEDNEDMDGIEMNDGERRPGKDVN
jgi:hypothetical protein